jgi:hypothetical protein
MARGPVNPRVTDYELEPDSSGTTTDEWDDPQLEDVSTDELSEVDDHFILSASRFPPENVTDLNPLVEPSGEVNENALQTAKTGGHGVGAVEGIDADLRSAVEDLVDELPNDNVEGTDFGE